MENLIFLLDFVNTLSPIPQRISVGYVPHRGNPRSQSRSRHAPAHAFTCALSAICLVPTAPAAPRHGGKIKGRKSLKQTPACPQNRLLCKFPKRNACVGKGRVAHAQLCPGKGIILFFRRCQERFRLQDLPLILRIYIFFSFKVISGAAAAGGRNEADPAGLICFSSGKTLLGRDRPGTVNGTRLTPGNGSARGRLPLRAAGLSQAGA